MWNWNWMTASAIVQALAAAIVAFFTWSLLRITERSWRTSVENAIAAKANADAAKAAAEGLKRSERAYVGLSHRFGFHARDWKGDTGPAGTTRYRVEMKLFNAGRTPALIAGGLVQLRPRLDQGSYALPQLTQMSRDVKGIPGTFLHAGEAYHTKLVFFLDASEIQTIADGKMWLLGYVDYSDTFGAHHRAGYCRWVKPTISAPKNNLLFEPVAARYNYDIEVETKAQA